MLTTDFDYHLPPELIAQTPIEPRDQSRLMVVNRAEKTIAHRHFFQLIDYLRPGDVLVWNNSKVFKARLRGQIELNEAAAGETPAGTTDDFVHMAPVEIFLVRPMENHGVWKVLARPGRRLRLGMKVVFAPDFSAEVMLKEKDGTILMQFAEDDVTVRAKANQYGEVPTPPYIAPNHPGTNTSVLSIEDRYQTVYATSEGSVAAPTAGFHFTLEMIEKIKAMGVELAEVTLHVGLGTFLPVKTEVVEEHQMHSEIAELTGKNADMILRAKAEGRRIVAVGTTTVRALEAIAATPEGFRSFAGEVNIFITPGYAFRVVDALITNFHLPKSTLLMLVSAFMGSKDFALECYEQAIADGYRFYSFGDAMFIE